MKTSAAWTRTSLSVRSPSAVTRPPVSPRPGRTLRRTRAQQHEAHGVELLHEGQHGVEVEFAGVGFIGELDGPGDGQQQDRVGWVTQRFLASAAVRVRWRSPRAMGDERVALRGTLRRSVERWCPTTAGSRRGRDAHAEPEQVVGVVDVQDGGRAVRSARATAVWRPRGRRSRSTRSAPAASSCSARAQAARGPCFSLSTVVPPLAWAASTRSGRHRATALPGHRHRVRAAGVELHPPPHHAGMATDAQRPTEHVQGARTSPRSRTRWVRSGRSENVPDVHRQLLERHWRTGQRSTPDSKPRRRARLPRRPGRA